MNAIRRSLNSEQRSLGWKSIALLLRPGAKVYIDYAASVIDGRRARATGWPLMAYEKAGRPRPTTKVRRVAALTLLAGVAVLLHGCGGSSHRAGASSSAPTNPSAPQISGAAPRPP